MDKTGITTVAAYVDQFEEAPRVWLNAFVRHMQREHSCIPGVISYQVPMYKFADTQIGFWAAKEHFSFHTVDFDMLDELKQELTPRFPRTTYTKSCARVRYGDVEAIPLLLEMINRIIAKHTD